MGFKKAGIYLWTVVIQNNNYKLYVGKAARQNGNGLGRLLEYLKPFQLNSPNDFKIQHFDDYMKRNESTDVLYQLYYYEYDATSVRALTHLEKEIREKLKPVFGNDRMPKRRVPELHALYQQIWDDYFDSKLK